MLRKSMSRGFTLTEILIVIAIMSTMAVISVATFQNMYERATIRAARSETYSAFIQARADTVASESDQVYGVHVGTSSVTRFEGSTFSTSSPTNSTYSFGHGITATSSIVSNGGVVVFERMTGHPSTYGTIYIRDAFAMNTTTVIVNASGLIE